MTDAIGRPIRIGRIDYTNVWPVFHYFDEKALGCRAEIVPAMPAALNRKLKQGVIDVAAISSFAYGQSADQYLLLPDLSVSALGRVQSILLFMKRPLEQVLNGKVALTTTSATSVNLLKIILEKFYGGKPTYEDVEPKLEHMLERADAALLIGDHAIRASWQRHGYRVIDLGEEWHRLTGRWMTFALWAVRRETALLRPETIRDVYEGFRKSKKAFAADPEPVIRKAMTQIGGTAAYWKGYFGRLYHGFGQEQLTGLQLYFHYARELGLMDRQPALTEWSPADPAYPRKSQVNL